MEAIANNQNRVLAEPISPQDHSLGPVEAAVTIVEYGDYECPDCLNAVPIIEQVMRELGDQVRFVFRHFPQNSVHPHASAAAEAAETAAEQGKFWEMHRALFGRQKELAEVDYAHLALTLGLELYSFENSQNVEKHRKRVAADYESGLRSGVHKTPTLFINGRQYDGRMEARAIVAAAKATVR